MAAIVDDRGFNQIYEQSEVNIIRLGRRAKWLIAEMNADPDKKVLEIGCGTGYVSHYIATNTNMQIIGSDLCRPFIDAANEKYVASNLSYEVLDFNDAASSIHNKFDYIVGNGILHHLYHNLSEVFITFKDLLNIGGKIIFMEPNIYNPYIAAIFKNKVLRKWAKLEPDEMAFSKSFIDQKLQAANFKNIDINYKDFLLPGIPPYLVAPFIAIGNVLEKTPFKIISQSILISAQKK